MLEGKELKQLMKFMEREEWQECHAQVLRDHFGSDIDAVMDSQWALALWNCAVDDFLTRDFGPRGNVLDDYLKRRGWRIGAGTKAYMKGLRTTVMSLYEVSDVVPGASFMARDIIRGGDLIPVRNQLFTGFLKNGDTIATRIVHVLNRNVLTVGTIPFSRPTCELLFKCLREMFGACVQDTPNKVTDDKLRQAALLFTVAFLYNGFPLRLDPDDDAASHNVLYNSHVPIGADPMKHVSTGFDHDHGQPWAKTGLKDKAPVY